MEENKQVPQALRNWFVVHFLMDILFAIPLMLFPVWAMTLFGWETVDPIATRVVAAALFGIGIESWLGRNAGVEQFQGMLNLKIIWSFAVIVGAGVSLIQGAQGAPLMGWALVGIFVAFNGLWVYWRLQLRD